MVLANEALIEGLGITALVLFALAGIIAFLHEKKINIVPFKIHPWIAVLALLIALTHMIIVLAQE